MSKNPKILKRFLIKIMLKDCFSSHFISHWRGATLDISSNLCFDSQYKSGGEKKERKNKK